MVYKEGVFVGYRGYEHNGVKPLFPFGYGLSYTTFKYSKLKADEHGFAPGATVAQVYVAPEHASVPRPVKELKGFSRVMLKPGETQTVKVPLNTRSFAYSCAR